MYVVARNFFHCRVVTKLLFALLHCSVSLMLNGVEVVSIGGGDESGSSNSILLALNRYDEVWLQLMQGSLTESKDRSRTGMTSFSGYRSDFGFVINWNHYNDHLK